MKTSITALLCAMAAFSQAQMPPQSTFRTVTHRKDRFPQPTDLMPPRFPPSALPHDANIVVTHTPVPIPISPAEPFTQADGPGPVDIQRRDVAIRIDETLVKNLGEQFEELCKQTPENPACRRFFDIMEHCPQGLMDSVTCRQAMQFSP